MPRYSKTLIILHRAMALLILAAWFTAEGGRQVRPNKQPPVDVPLLKGLFQRPEQFLGEGRVPAFLDQTPDERLLGGHTPLTLGNVLLRLGKVLAFHEWVGHRFGSRSGAVDESRTGLH